MLEFALFNDAYLLYYFQNSPNNVSDGYALFNIINQNSYSTILGNYSTRSVIYRVKSLLDLCSQTKFLIAVSLSALTSVT